MVRVTRADPLEVVPLETLRTRRSTKWRTFAPDVLPLWVAEMDVELAPAVVDAICRAASSGDTGYAAGDGYAEALAGFAERRWGWPGLPVDRCALVADVMVGITEAVRLVTRPGDTVVVSPPVYPPFYAFAEHAGRRVAEAPLGRDGRLDLPLLDEVFAVAGQRGRRAAYLLCNPHNPTGSVPTRGELSALAELAERHGVRVVADEIHAPLVLPGAHFVPYLSVVPDGDAFVVTSASKGWNLAGLKAAVLMAGAGAEGDLRRLPEIVSHGPAHLGVLAHTAALTDGDEWLDALLAGLDRKRALLADLLAAHLPGARWQPPEGTYLAWLDCSDLAAARHGDDGVERWGAGDVTTVVGAARFFLDRARVGLTAGEPFGAGGDGHVRLNFATSAQVLTAAVRAMGDAEAAAVPS